MPEVSTLKRVRRRLISAARSRGTVDTATAACAATLSSKYQRQRAIRTSGVEEIGIKIENSLSSLSSSLSTLQRLTADMAPWHPC